PRGLRLVFQARRDELPRLVRERGVLPHHLQRSVNLGGEATGGPELTQRGELFFGLAVLALPQVRKREVQPGRFVLRISLGRAAEVRYRLVELSFLVSGAAGPGERSEPAGLSRQH